jgi:HNH endonuclease
METAPYTISVLEVPTATCNCVGKHIPKPMELHRHHIWPVGEGGPDTKENLLTLCPSTHSNVHRLWRLYEKHDGRPPWEILRNYSEYVRWVVEKGRELRRASEQSQSRPHESSSGYPSTYVLDRE